MYSIQLSLKKALFLSCGFYILMSHQLMAEQNIFVPQPAQEVSGNKGKSLNLSSIFKGCEGEAECNNLQLYCSSDQPLKVNTPELSEETRVGIVGSTNPSISFSLNGEMFPITASTLNYSEMSGGWSLSGHVFDDKVYYSLGYDRVYLLVGKNIFQIETNDNFRKFVSSCITMREPKAPKQKPNFFPKDQYWNCKNDKSPAGEVRTLINKSTGVMTVLSKRNGLNFKAPYRYCHSSHCTWVIDGATDDPIASEQSGSVYITMADDIPSLQIYLPTGILGCERK